MSDPVCPLCDRPIPPDAPQSLHHLIPKLKGGKGGPTVLLHHICHREVHASLSEAELARDYNTPEALRAHFNSGKNPTVLYVYMYSREVESKGHCRLYP